MNMSDHGNINLVEEKKDETSEISGPNASAAVVEADGVQQGDARNVTPDQIEGIAAAHAMTAAGQDLVADNMNNLERSGDMGDEEGVIDSGGEYSDSDLDNEIAILDPNHPLMTRFQDALGRHLKERFNQLSLDERELQHKLSAKVKDRESLGVTLYANQQDLAQQQAKLEFVNQELQAHTAQRLYREAEMNNIRKLYKKVANEVEASRRQAADLQKELDNANLRMFFMLASGTDVKNDALVLKRAALKTRQDLAKSELEKQRQDYMVDLLVQQVDAKKREIAMYEAQCTAQHDETVSHKLMLTEANIELSVLQTDMMQLEQHWKSTLIGMRRRDEAFASMMESIRVEEQKLLCKIKEIDAYKRNVLQSEEKHERLMYILSKANNDIAHTKKATSKCMCKMEELQIEYSEKQRVLQQTENGLAIAHTDKRNCKEELAGLRKEYEQMCQQRNGIKNELVEILQTQASYVKAAEYTKRKVDLVIARTERMDNEMAQEENILASIDQEMIACTTLTAMLKENLEEVKQGQANRNNLITNHQTTFGKNLVLIERKQNRMDQINKRLALLLEQTEGEEMSPLENTVRNLTKQVKKENSRMLEDQTMWVEHQYEFLNLCKQKRQLQDDMKHCNQEIFVLSGKKKRLTGQIDEEMKEKKKWEREMKHIRTELETVALLVVKKQGESEDMQASGYLAETDFVRELKEREMEVLKINDKLKALHQQKEFLLNQIIELEQQANIWIRKIQLGVEMKEAVDSKSGQGAEIRSMKCEIHRMEVRYLSLEREQEALIRKMEDSVTRRDYIVYASKAAAKRDPNILTNSKCKRRVTQTKEKLSKTKQDIIKVEDNKKELYSTRQELGEKINNKAGEVTSFKSEISLLDAKCQVLQKTKLKNLNELVTRQRRSSLYSDLKNGKYRRTSKNDSQLNAESKQEQEKMIKIKQIVAKLTDSHPNSADGLELVLACYGFRDAVTYE